MSKILHNSEIPNKRKLKKKDIKTYREQITTKEPPSLKTTECIYTPNKLKKQTKTELREIY